MIPTSRFLFSRLAHSRALLVALIGLVSTSLLSGASQLLLYHSPGGPMEYNEIGAVMENGYWVTKLSLTFEVPAALRIQKIKAWINGPVWGTATFSIIPLADEPPYVGYSQTFSTDPVTGAPAKWQGLDSLKWDLPPGPYEFYMEAPDVPLGYGALPPYPNLDSLLDSSDYKDYSNPDNPDPYPFGLQVYGTFAPVPEPSFYGLMGGAGLMALAATRRLKRKSRKGSEKSPALVASIE